MYLADYHIHSNSPDAGQDMRQMCRAAIARGLDEIVFTDHYEFYSGGIRTKYFHQEYLQQYFADLDECKSLFAGTLNVKAGLEAGQGYHDRQGQQEVLSAYPFDYVIGSLHKLHNVDLANLWWGSSDAAKEIIKCSQEAQQITEVYYKELIQMTRQADFDCLGHLDLVGRYAKRAGFTIETTNYMALITEVLNNLIVQDKGLEINTSSLREGMAETMPGTAVLQAYRALGGRIVTIGSDAHKPEAIGQDIKTAHELLKNAGFTSYAIYNKRKYSFIDLK